MTTLANFPLVSQRSTVTSDGKVSENALFDCVPASIGAVMLWLEKKAQWDSSINPDLLKDKAYGDAYAGGTSAAAYVAICKSLGFTLSPMDTSSPSQTVARARQLLAENTPVIFTELDPYVDTSLPQYSGWTHVCVWFADDANGLTAMDPFIAQPVYKSDATWENLLRANQVWTVERIQSMGGIPGGWRPDGTILYSPNSVQGQPEVPITGPFRDYILANPWPNGNVALEEGHHEDIMEQSNPHLGGGFVQTFRYSRLEMPDSGPMAGKVIFSWFGIELLWMQAHLQQAQFDLATQKHEVATLTTQLQQANAQIAQEQAQVKSLQAELQGKPDLAALANRLSTIGLEAKQASDILAEVQQQAAQPIR